MARSKATLYRMTDADARLMLEGIRWPDGPVCPKCNSDKVSAMNGKTCRPGLKQCRNCRKQFTVTVGTIFESSHIGLGDWMFAVAAMTASKKGISALQLQRMLNLGSYETAWFMCHRIRHAMLTGTGFLKGAVEVDEAYVGGRPRPSNNPEAPKPEGKKVTGRGTAKVPIVALVERSGKAHVRVVADVTAKTLKDVIVSVVEPTSTIFTDEWASYTGIGKKFDGGHKTVNHGSGTYALPDGTNTNTVESFFALIKRGVYGNFHHVSKKHLFRYLGEFEFRWNHRHSSDEVRAVQALRQTSGKRLTYRESTRHAAV